MTEDPTAYETPEEEEPSEEQLMAEGAEALRALLAAEPTTEEELVAVLQRRLSEPITPDTWGTIVHSITSYVGERGFNILAWAGVSEPGDQSRLDALEEAGGHTVANLGRRITAQFGDELRYAYEISGQLPDNWRLLNREVFFDVINNHHFLRIHVEKYGGERTIIEGPPDSILSLTTFLVGALRFTADANAFSEERLNEFAAELGPFTELIQPRMEQLAAKEAALVEQPA
jgi:hypothetical protein